MKTYKDENNNLYAYEEDGSQDHLIQGKTLITEAEAYAIRNTLPTQEELDQITIDNWKAQRTKLVQEIVVIYNGESYQGDETSQDRMSRSINALPDDTMTVSWITLDNKIVPLTKLDLQSILLLAGTKQSLIWTDGK